ncbi:MAG: hypothetical protein ACOX3X_03035 [Eubacteriales bacterium]|jgi:hypothetical protein
MDYIERAIDLLQNRNQLLNAKTVLDEELEMLESEKYSAKHSAITDTTVARDGGSKYEEHLINLISMIDHTMFRKRTVERQLKMIANGLSVLDDYERDLLEVFYIYKVKSPAEVIMKKHYKERSQVYADRKKALIKFTRGIYGIVHI